jgi:site-specific DNA-methyltransferase (adenine-specific)
VPKPKKTPRAAKPLYFQKLPKLADDDFVHATPIVPARFELREDGSIHVDGRAPAVEQIKTPPPRLTYSDPDRQLWLYQGNCLELLDAIAAKHPEGRFDAIFADPPYFLSNGGISCHAGRMVKVDKGDWDKSQGAEVNHEFNREWLLRCQRVLKPNGTIWVTGTHHVIFSIGYAMQQLGYKILNDIAWEKPNPPPNLSCRYFTHSTETVLWAAKSEKSKHVFNYQEMRKVTGKQMKTVWTMTAPSGEEKKFGKHPTQKPIALVERCLLASTNKGDMVLDPFQGGGYDNNRSFSTRPKSRRNRAGRSVCQTFNPTYQGRKRKGRRPFFNNAIWKIKRRRCVVKEGGVGGANTLTGLHFERKVDLHDLLAAKPGYEVKKISGKAGKGVYFKGRLVARCFRKYDFYKFLDEEGVDWKSMLSKRLLPDDALLVIVRETLFIIEVKYQQGAGSVDEKLQTCDFKKKQFQKLVRSLNLKVEYVYILNDWFSDPTYKDCLDYIDSVGCHYRFNTLPLSWLGLPEA